jgi:hypothetical protein
VSRLAALLRHAPRPDDLPRIAAVAAARALTRRGERRGSGYVSDEAPLIVAGMHRSGTSIVTRLLERAGMFAGGSWLDENHESIHFSRANRAMCGEGPYLLYDYGWTAPKSDDFIAARRGYAERAARDSAPFFADRRDEPLWGWKDPRNSLTLPVWLSIYPRAQVLHVVRDGRAVALSLAERDSLDLSFGMALWAHYVTRADRSMAALPQERRLTVRFEDLTDAPAPVLERLYRFAGLAPALDLEQIAADVKRERGTAPLADPRVADLGDHPLLARYSYR